MPSTRVLRYFTSFSPYNSLFGKCFYWLRIRKLRLRKDPMAFPELHGVPWTGEGGTQVGLTAVPTMLLIAMSVVPVFQGKQGSLWRGSCLLTCLFCFAFLSTALGMEEACFRASVLGALLDTKTLTCVSHPVISMSKIMLAELPSSALTQHSL